MDMHNTMETKLPVKGSGGVRARGHLSIESVDIVFGSGKDKNVAVDDANLDIKPGEFICLLGPSGCGKSTLMNAVAGYVQPTAGTVLLDGQPIKGPGADRGMVFQQYSLFPWKTVKENIAFGPKMTGGNSEGEDVAATFLDMVGLGNFADAYPMMLSGGMQQRVGIARALANYPAVLLMDEPFGALDAQTRTMMQESLLNIWQEFKNTVVFVTHDVDEAVFLADRVVVMSASPGKILKDITVPLPRPRDLSMVTSPEFLEVKAGCLEIIRQESLRAFEQQRNRG